MQQLQSDMMATHVKCKRTSDNLNTISRLSVFLDQLPEAPELYVK